jgi:hypothetical protein
LLRDEKVPDGLENRPTKNMTNPTPQPNVARFDRLVDGELSSAEYQALLAALDEEPDGWRRCALSFLEAQALERELGSLRSERIEPAAAPSLALVQPSPQPQALPHRVSYPLMALAVAASFLVAFGLGLAIRHDGSPDGTGTGQIAETNPPAPSQSDDRALASNDRNADSGSSPAPRAGDQPMGNVTLVVDGQRPADQQRVEVPLYNYDQVGQDYLTSDQSALSPEVREMLERNGHQFRSHRQLVPMRLNDGQQAVFPMEEVEILPVRMPAF